MKITILKLFECPQIIMESKEEEARAYLVKEIASLSTPIEELTIRQLQKARDEQAAVIQKMKQLTSTLDEIETILPRNNINEATEKICKLCERIEQCKYRINLVHRKTETMLQILSRPKPQLKQNKLIELV